MTRRSWGRRYADADTIVNAEACMVTGAVTAYFQDDELLREMMKRAEEQELARAVAQRETIPDDKLS